MFEVNKELLDSHEALLNVVFEEETVEGAKRRAARRISREVNIPGFRKGKAPYTKVVHWVGEPAVMQEAAELLLDESYSDILDKADVSPYASGEFVDMQTDPLTFKIRVPLEPEVDLGDYKSLREDWEAPTVSDEEVDEVLAQLREENAILEAVDRPAEMGDQLTVDVQAKADDDTIVDEDDIEVVLSEERPFLSPEFVTALVGLSADEDSTFLLTLPDTIDEPSLRGIEAEFTVHVNTVYERKLAELDDALASTVGSFETFEELRQDIVDRIMAQKEQQAETDYRDKLIEKLVAQAEFEYPPQMVDDRVHEMMHETEERVERQSKMAFEDALRLEGRTLEQFQEQIRPQAEQRVRQSLALREFAEQEGIAVNDDEVVREYTTFMRQFGGAQGLSAEDVDLDSSLAQSFRNSVFGRKVMERLAAIGRGEADVDTTVTDDVPEAEAVESADAEAEVSTEAEVAAESEVPAEVGTEEAEA